MNKITAFKGLKYANHEMLMHKTYQEIMLYACVQKGRGKNEFYCGYETLREVASMDGAISDEQKCHTFKEKCLIAFVS